MRIVELTQRVEENLLEDLFKTKPATTMANMRDRVAAIVDGCQGDAGTTPYSNIRRSLTVPKIERRHIWSDRGRD